MASRKSQSPVVGKKKTRSRSMRKRNIAEFKEPAVLLDDPFADQPDYKTPLTYPYVGLRGFQNSDGSLNINGIQLPTNAATCSPYYVLNMDASKLLGEGSYGATYEACLQGGGSCDFVGKVIPLTPSPDNFLTVDDARDFQLRNFLLESYIGHYMGKQNIGPIVYSAFRCYKDKELVGIIIMEKLGRPLSKIKLNAESWKNLSDKIKALHGEGVIHNDLYVRNIMTTAATQYAKSPEFRIIDYGAALILNNPWDHSTLKMAELFDFFWGETRLGYQYYPEFESLDERRKAWFEMVRTEDVDDFREAMKYVTFGWPEDEVDDSTQMESFDHVYAALLKGRDDKKSAEPYRGQFYEKVFKNLLSAQREMRYLNIYALQMGRETSIAPYRPFVKLEQQEILMRYLHRVYDLPKQYLSNYFLDR